MEGKKFGWYTLPDIDDVVVVMFIGGDIEPAGDPRRRVEQARLLAGAERGRQEQLPRLSQPLGPPPHPRRHRQDEGRVRRQDDEEHGRHRQVREGRRRSEHVRGLQAARWPATTGVSISSMEGKLEITCKDGRAQGQRRQERQDQREDDDRHQGDRRAQDDGSSAREAHVAGQQQLRRSAKVDIA